MKGKNNAFILFSQCVYIFTAGDSVYNVNTNKTVINTDLGKSKYLIYNDLSNDSNHIVCTIKAIENKNISIQLLYVDWNMAPKCDDSQENVSVGNTVYTCKNRLVYIATSFFLFFFFVLFIQIFILIVVD